MKLFRLCSISMAAAIFMLASSAAVPAQYEYRRYTMPSGVGGVFNNSISALISATTWNRMYLQVLGRQGASSPSPSPSPSQAAPNRKPDESAMRFRPTGKHISTQSLADQLGSTPVEREQYVKLMNAVIDAFDERVKQAGLENDLAIALSYFLAENARIYRGQPELSDEKYINIRNAIAEVLAGSGALNNINDRRKQEIYEGLVAYTGITQFGYEQARQAHNSEIAKGYQQVAGQNLQTVTRMSPDSINLTDKQR